jgi:hypothetical protein
LEEYGDILHDEHDRFPAKQSILHQFGWLQRMVCERWSKAIMDYLTENKLMTVALKKRAIELVPTFDIDNAFAYKWKEGSRQILATAKDYLKRNKTRINERKQVLAGKIKDPYDTFETIKTIGENFKNTLIFWLLADHANFDKNIFHADQRQIALIKELNKNCEVGIHPSYNSNTKSGQQQIEISRLTTILERKTLNSRQHYLKFRLPKTYNELIENGIEHDYSMGYASEVGFRAGTSRPFLWFDIQKNRTTSLWIHPFAYMDGTLLEYQHLSTDEAKQIISSLYSEFKKFGGEFIFLWHNETIGDYGKWKGWSEVLEHTLNLRNHE